MRRMLDKTDVENVVNKGIEEGSIVSGLQVEPLGVGEYEYQSEIELGEVLIPTQLTVSEILTNYKAIIFTMNNSFVMTPLAQNGQTLTLGNFAYDEAGNSSIARLRIQLLVDEETGKAIVDVLFDATFSGIMTVTPGAMLLGVK